MFVCEKNSACIGCNYQNADRIDDIDEEFRDCQNLTEVESVKHGRWLEVNDTASPELRGKHVCSECGAVAMLDWNSHKEELTDYCPRCNAKMDMQIYFDAERLGESL